MNLENITHSEMVTALAKDGKEILESLTPIECDLLHMGVGVVGEAGELIDAIKKSVIYRKSLDRENVIEELGDLEFYLERIRQIVNVTREETLKTNMEKLLTGEKARYKVGVYTDKQAQERQDKI